jgi:ribonuclease R
VPEIRYKQSKLESLGDHISVSERNSVDAERESVKTKLLEFYDRELQKEQKQHFKAIITDVKNHGLFVELTDTLAFGMVHISTLDDDFYHPNSEGTALTGRRKKRTYALGQYIMVQVERVDRFKRQIDFRVVLADDRDKDKKPGKPFKGRDKIGQARSKKSSERSSSEKAAKTLTRRKPKKKSAQEKNPSTEGKVITKRPKKNQRNKGSR